MKTRIPFFRITNPQGRRVPVLWALIFLFAVPVVRADEGMWLFENFPEQKVREKYDFQFPENWLSKVQLASCRFANRGSASFISPKGLILTNHHVGARNLHELSTPENSLLEKGFYAKTQADELKCSGVEVLVLEKILDITPEITEAVAKAGTPEDAAKLRSQFIAAVEQKTSEKTGLRCEVITLYHGGAYHLYGYKVYDDIRLVWAPEESIAAFGGDPDNYEYPRFCLDAMMFRAYENDKPAEIEHYLPWKSTELKDGDLTFVAGFPGTTNRAYTKEHLEFMRDVYFPHRLQKLFRRETIYAAYGNRSMENQRRIADDLGTVQNYRKRAMGQLDGLQTPTLWDEKTTAAEADGQSNPATTPEGKIGAACLFAKENGRFFAYDLLEKGDFMKTGGDAFNCRTFLIAKTLVRLALESEKPNAERQREFQEGNLDSLKRNLLNDAPIYEDVEILKLTDSLTMLREFDGGKLWFRVLDCLDDESKKSVRMKSPKQWARELVGGSKVRDLAERKRLVDGGVDAIKKSDDPMIRLALAMDPMCRELGKEYGNRVLNPITAAYTELARKRFEEKGTDIYPDATFTLRLSYGAVKGYKEDNGTEVAPTTNIAGMFQRAENQKFKEPFDPPQSWKDAKDKLDLNTAFDLVTTNDIIGGNSGSPLINAKGELIGLVFDGNIYSLSNNFVYSEEQSRCVSVHADVILEALKKVYNAERIVEELEK